MLHEGVPRCKRHRRRAAVVPAIMAGMQAAFHNAQIVGVGVRIRKACTLPRARRCSWSLNIVAAMLVATAPAPRPASAAAPAAPLAVKVLVVNMVQTEAAPWLFGPPAPRRD